MTLQELLAKGSTEAFEKDLSTLDENKTHVLRELLAAKASRIGDRHPEFNPTMEQLEATGKHLARLKEKSKPGALR